MEKKDILERLKKSVKEKESIIGVSIGNGRSANQAFEGGADILLALNAGRYRMSGAPSMMAMLPFANANEMVFDFATKEVIPRVKTIPILFGACAQDPSIDHDVLIERIMREGFSGVNNFPTVSLFDGRYREMLEENDEGYGHEVALLRRANEKGLFTVAFSVTEAEAVMMAHANVDVLCLHFGWTYINRPKENELKPHVDKLIKKANKTFEKVLAIKPDMLLTIYGGAIVRNIDIMKRFYTETKAIGYFGGSVFDVLPVENSIKDTLESFKHIKRADALEKENKILKSLLIDKERVKSILGNSGEMQKMRSFVRKVSNYNANILIVGESGTGKDLVVNAIHYSSDRAIYPLKKVNCASIPQNLIESELFGHEKGAFPGADKQHIGRFERADKGTLFLDNITELDIEVQAKLLRVVQDQEFERVGGNETIQIDVRVISTTNSDIKREVDENLFREDLFYLLNVVQITVPPLRSHKMDIPLYLSEFLENINEKYNSKIKVTPDVQEAFMKYDWPGNIRELKNTLERGVIFCEENDFNETCLPATFNQYIKKDTQVNYIKNTSIIMEKELILQELKKVNWNQTKAAKNLGVTRRTLYNKIKKYNFKKN